MSEADKILTEIIDDQVVKLVSKVIHKKIGHIMEEMRGSYLDLQKVTSELEEFKTQVCETFNRTGMSDELFNLLISNEWVDRDNKPWHLQCKHCGQDEFFGL